MWMSKAAKSLMSKRMQVAPLGSRQRRSVRVQSSTGMKL
jgi:hypothetical protein